MCVCVCVVPGFCLIILLKPNTVCSATVLVGSPYIESDTQDFVTLDLVSDAKEFLTNLDIIYVKFLLLPSFHFIRILSYPLKWHAFDI